MLLYLKSKNTNAYAANAAIIKYNSVPPSATMSELNSQFQMGKYSLALVLTYFVRENNSLYPSHVNAENDVGNMDEALPDRSLYVRTDPNTPYISGNRNSRLIASRTTNAIILPRFFPIQERPDMFIASFSFFRDGHLHRRDSRDYRA